MALLRGLGLRGSRGLEHVDRGVWRLQMNPGRINVYFIETDDGVVQFDAGGRMMLDAVRAAEAKLGTVRKVVLGHGHTDHRGTAPHSRAPVACHPDEVEDAAGSGGFRYWGDELSEIPQPRRFLQRDVLHPRFWDAGPVQISETVEDGEEIAGFRVRHLPGHSPGQIALIRERDGVALTTDVFYTIDEWGRDAPAGVPEDVWNWNPAAAAESLRELADMSVTRAWPGHGDPLEDRVAEKLRRGAEVHEQRRLR